MTLIVILYLVREEAHIGSIDIVEIRGDSRKRGDRKDFLLEDEYCDNRNVVTGVLLEDKHCDIEGIGRK